MPCNMTEVQPGDEWMNECLDVTAGLIPVTLISFTFIDWEKEDVTF